MRTICAYAADASGDWQEEGPSAIIPKLNALGFSFTQSQLYWMAAMPGLKPRATTLVDLAASAKFYVASRPLAPSEQASSRTCCSTSGCRW